jgi:LytS/YehU family sensor histidine kinase
MLYECNQEKISLEQELTMLKEYILLEQARYDDKLDIVMDFPVRMDSYCIAPLLLLPLVDNCFKHGASTMLEQPWIHISIIVQEGTLNMKLVNGKPMKEPVQELKPGIGLTNVRHRLSLLYSNKHSLQLFNEEAMFIVNLKLELEQLSESEKAITTLKNELYV